MSEVVVRQPRLGDHGGSETSNGRTYYCMSFSSTHGDCKTLVDNDGEPDRKTLDYVRGKLQDVWMEPRMIWQRNDTKEFVEVRPYLYQIRQIDRRQEDFLHAAGEVPRSPYIRLPMAHHENWPRPCYHAFEFRLQEGQYLSQYIELSRQAFGRSEVRVPAALLWRLLYDIFHPAVLLRKTGSQVMVNLDSAAIELVNDDGRFRDGTDELPHAVLHDLHYTQPWRGRAKKEWSPQLYHQQFDDETRYICTVLEDWALTPQVNALLRKYPSNLPISPQACIQIKVSVLQSHLSYEQLLSELGPGSAITDKALTDFIGAITWRFEFEPPGDSNAGGPDELLAEVLPKMRGYENQARKRLDGVPAWVKGFVDRREDVCTFNQIVRTAEESLEGTGTMSNAKMLGPAMMDRCAQIVLQGLETDSDEEIWDQGGVFRLDKTIPVNQDHQHWAPPHHNEDEGEDGGNEVDDGDGNNANAHGTDVEIPE